jgi:regulator of protease activity HflC (stomatin/prohibitin superfamily)
VDEEYYVNITAVVLTNIDFSDAFEKAVEDKMIAEQAKLKADYENDTKVAKAKAEADALLIQAKAQAEANELLTESLTDEVLESKFYEKWDGKLPQVMGEGSAILDIRDDEE